MKYMILTYASQRDYDGMAGVTGEASAWAPEDFAAMGEFMARFNAELEASGELVETRGLAAPSQTIRLGNRDGVPFVTDGPYAETEEVLAGYWIIDVASPERAREIAARLGQTPGPDHVRNRAYADVRPLVESREDLLD